MEEGRVNRETRLLAHYRGWVMALAGFLLWAAAWRLLACDCWPATTLPDGVRDLATLAIPGLLSGHMFSM